MSENLRSRREKARFTVPIEGSAQEYLGLTVWSTRNDPNAEVISVDVRHPEGDDWKTLGRVAVYRTPDGRYRKLPEREKPLK